MQLFNEFRWLKRSGPETIIYSAILLQTYKKQAVLRLQSISRFLFGELDSIDTFTEEDNKIVTHASAFIRKYAKEIPKSS